MFLSDLSPYSELGSVEPNVLAVGWLDSRHPFPTGHVSEEFKARLFELCLTPVKKTRGFHQCPFCERPPIGQEEKRNNISLILGSAEIWVEGPAGITYAAPDLIYHYVMKHLYLPPEVFVLTVVEHI